MLVAVFFIVVIAFSLALCAIDKIRNYNRKDSTMFIDVDSVVVKRKKNQSLDTESSDI